jgi:tetratricopeptide (TPR) repeat protein/tRNA A-37 threonylcarbamoyl transferase component Bud32
MLLAAALVLAPGIVSAGGGKKTPAAPPNGEPDWEAIGAVTGVIPGFDPQRLADPAKLAEDLRREMARRDPSLPTVPGDTFNRGIAALLQLAEKNGMVKPDPVAVNPQPTTPGQTVNPAPTAPERFYRVVAQQTPDQPGVHVELGRYAYDRKDFRTALSDYEKAVKLDPANQEALLGYGHSANELGDYQLASMAAKQLLARDPGNADALGLYHFANGRAPVVSLPSAIFQGGAGDAGGPAAGAGGGASGFAGARGGSYVASNMTPEQVAAAARAQAAAAGPGSAERSASITRDAAAALRVKDYPTAHDLASQAIVLNAANAQALNFRAIASNRMRRYSDAVTDASAALALAPGNAPALQTRSWAFAKQGNYQEALKDAEATLARDPANPFAYQNKALALAGLKDRAGALEALRRSAALDPRFQNRLERALQLPQEQDLTMLFDDESAAQTAAAAVAPPPQTGKRFARLAVLSAMGGILIALGILHVVSASWREKVNMTIRRVLAPSDAVGSEDSAAAATPLPSSPGAAFWLQYELIKEIGLGGMGVVYEAMDRSLERRVAVKKMRDEIRIDPHERRRFVNEAKLVAQLRHPNIVDIYAIVEEGQEVYLVFEFVSGRTLHDQIKSEGPMSLESARWVLHAAAEAVEHAHAAQIVHRDLKPSNIMITDDGRVKVMDFGVARQAKDAITKMSMTNTVVGTPPYMAPEQEQGTVRRESDVYALGVCLYEMLTGHLPFTGGGAAMLLNKLNGKHIPPSQRNAALPAALDAVIAKALIPDPDKRYHTPTELVAALDAVIAGNA